MGDGDLLHLAGLRDRLGKGHAPEVENDRACRRGDAAHARGLYDAAVPDPRELVGLRELGGGVLAGHIGCRCCEPSSGKSRDLYAELTPVAAKGRDHGGIRDAVCRDSRGAGRTLTVAVEEARSVDYVFYRLHDDLFRQVKRKQLRENYLVKQQVGRGLARVVLVAHLHALGEDGLERDAAVFRQHLAHGREKLLAHMAQVFRDVLAVKPPAAEAALKGALCWEGRSAGVVAPILDDDHRKGLCDDARARTDCVVVERGVDLYLARVQKLHRFPLVLRPAFKKHRADHAAPVQHDHVVQVHRRA